MKRESVVLFESRYVNKQVARELGVNHHWIAKYGDKLKKVDVGEDLTAESKLLLRELKRVEMERDIIKKL